MARAAGQRPYGHLGSFAVGGRIDLTNAGRWVGSGWLVAEDIVATCQHVALEFAYGTAPYRFRGDPGCTFDSLYEHERPRQRAVAVRRVEWVAPSVPGALDVAFRGSVAHAVAREGEGRP